MNEFKPPNDAEYKALAAAHARLCMVARTLISSRLSDPVNKPWRSFLSAVDSGYLEQLQQAVEQPPGEFARDDDHGNMYEPPMPPPAVSFPSESRPALPPNAQYPVYDQMKDMLEYILEITESSIAGMSCDAGHWDGGNWTNCDHCQACGLRDQLKALIAKAAHSGLPVELLSRAKSFDAGLPPDVSCWVLDEDDLDFDPDGLCHMSIEYRGSTGWTILYHQWCIDKVTGQFIREPMPSSRTERFYQRTRFSTAQEAFSYLEKWKPKMREAALRKRGFNRWKDRSMVRLPQSD